MTVVFCLKIFNRLLEKNWHQNDITVRSCFLCGFCMSHAAFALVKYIGKGILLTAEILDCENLFRCLKIHIKHIDIIFTKQFLQETGSCLFYPVKKPVAFQFHRTLCISLLFFFSLLSSLYLRTNDTFMWFHFHQHKTNKTLEQQLFIKRSNLRKMLL